MQSNLNKRGFSIQDISKIYGISRQTIYNEINSGNLKTFKIGRRRLITLSAIESWELLLESKTLNAHVGGVSHA